MSEDGRILASASASTPARVGRLCIGCRPRGRCYLGIERLELMPGGDVLGVAVCTVMEGGPGTAHGGWSAAVADEVLGMLTDMHGAPTITLHLELDYRAPVPIGEPVEIHGRCVRREGRKWYVVGEFVRDGAVLVEASGLMLEPRSAVS